MERLTEWRGWTTPTLALNYTITESIGIIERHFEITRFIMQSTALSNYTEHLPERPIVDDGSEKSLLRCNRYNPIAMSVAIL